MRVCGVCVVCVQYILGLWVAVNPCGQILQGNVWCVCVCSIYLGFGWPSNHVTKCYKGMCGVCVQYIPGLWVAV